MATRPLISFVLTAHNTEKFIAKAVGSAFAQTYSPLQIVLSDDYSTDNTYDIMKQRADAYSGPHNIVLNRNSENIGITQHMNKAYLELAQGEYIVVAHGDDISLPGRVAHAWDFLRDHSECSALSHSIRPIDEKEHFISVLANNYRVDDIRMFTLPDGPNNSLPNIPSPSRIIRKEVMTRFGPLQHDCPTEDDPIGLRALLLGTCAFLPDEMVFYRKHEASESNSANFYRFPLDRILNQHLKDIQIAEIAKIISSEKAQQLRTCLENAFICRRLTRDHYARKDMQSLCAILLSRQFNIREKLSRMRLHLRYMRFPEAYR